jgi:hypothetical protein
MGSFISAHRMFQGNDSSKGNNVNNSNNKNKTICFICSEHIQEKEHTVCVRCQIGIHNICEESYRTNKYFTVCPHCDRCGSLATKVNL